MLPSLYPDPETEKPMKSILSIVALVGLASVVAAKENPVIRRVGEHLNPCPAFYSDVHPLLVDHLTLVRSALVALRPPVRALPIRMVVMHSGLEVLTVFPTETAGEVQVVKFDGHIIGKDAGLTRRSEKHSAIEKTTLDEVVKAWNSVLLESKFDQEPRRGLDGVEYYFVFGNMCGSIWGPERFSRPSDLVELGGLLMTIVESTEQRRPHIEKDVRAAAARIVTFHDR
jgi:hypothetical protein